MARLLTALCVCGAIMASPALGGRTDRQTIPPDPRPIVSCIQAPQMCWTHTAPR